MTDNQEQRSIRRSQCVTPFGVGAIHDLGKESLLAKDITFWEPPGGGSPIGSKIELKRLSDDIRSKWKVEVPLFYAPPKMVESKNGQDGHAADREMVPFTRFPKWLFCPNTSCNRLIHWRGSMEKRLDPNALPACPDCHNRGETTMLAPVRWVCICPHGHLMDVPWHTWLHARHGNGEQQRCQVKDRMIYKSTNQGGGSLFSIEIGCRACGARATAGDLLNEDVSWDCVGHQPWQNAGEGHVCPGSLDRVPEGELKMRVVQRGASNVTYPVVESAIDIPPLALWSARSTSHDRGFDTKDFETLVSNCLAETSWESSQEMEIALYADEYSKSDAEVREAIRTAIHTRDSMSNTVFSDDINFGEWTALIAPPEDPHPKDNFICRLASLRGIDPARFEVDESMIEFLLNSLRCVSLVEKLREVRALVGFRRYDDLCEVIQSDLDDGRKWRSGIEVFGEGIFIGFKEEALQRWEEQSADQIENRLGRLVKMHQDGLIPDWMPEPSGRFIMLHTLSHLLLRQLAFECGYGASSLREKIYCDVGPDPERRMAGILIYTAENDSEGSLGGLVRQGEPAQLLPTISVALRRARWCSNDPICSEIEGQGTRGLNRAACHACSLIAETSCPYGNVLLDRGCLLGDGGFFPPFSSRVSR